MLKSNPSAVSGVSSEGTAVTKVAANRSNFRNAPVCDNLFILEDVLSTDWMPFCLLLFPFLD